MRYRIYRNHIEGDIEDPYKILYEKLDIACDRAAVLASGHKTTYLVKDEDGHIVFLAEYAGLE